MPTSKLPACDGVQNFSNPRTYDSSFRRSSAVPHPSIIILYSPDGVDLLQYTSNSNGPTPEGHA